MLINNEHKHQPEDILLGQHNILQQKINTNLLFKAKTISG